MKKIQQLFHTLISSDKFWYLLIFAVPFLLFSPSLGDRELLSDDLAYFWNVRSIAVSLKNCFEPVLELRTPLTGFSLYLNYLAGGNEHFVFFARLTNILLHCSTSLLFFALLRQLEWKGKPLPLFWPGITALIFALHPQRVESVVWIAERKDCLAMCLGLASLFVFYSAVRNNKVSILSPLLLLLSIAAKPMWLFFFVPAAILLWYRKIPLSLKNYLRFLWPSLAVTAGTLLLYAISILGAIQCTWSNSNSGSVLQRFETVCFNCGSYFFKTFIPGTLLPCYPLYNPASPDRLYALIPLFFLLFCFFLYKKNRNLLWNGIIPVFVCYIVSLLPVIGFVKLGSTDFADRYSYMPSLFLLTGAMFALLYLSEKISFPPRLLPAAATAACLLLGFQTFLYCRVWSNSEKLYENSLKPHFPHATIAIVHSVKLYNARKFDEMFQFLNTRLPELSHYSKPHKRMIKLFKISVTGLTLLQLGRENEGMRYLNIVYGIEGNGAIKQYPVSFLYEIFSKGADHYLKRQKDPVTAAAVYKGGALVLKHHSPQYGHYFNGRAAMVLKKYGEAAEFFKKCLAVNPDDPEYQKQYKLAQKLQEP